MNSDELRARGIAARKQITGEARRRAEEAILRQTAALPAFTDARTVMLYRARGGEPSPEGLCTLPEAAGKRFAYPFCVDERRMIALAPLPGCGWVRDAAGLPAPDPARAIPVPPGEIDLVLCPCTAFDDALHRLGSGRGYYDRFLPECRRAHCVGLAFEAQRARRIEAQAWDRPMETFITEQSHPKTE